MTSTAEKTTAKRKGPGRPAADDAANAIDLSGLEFAPAQMPKRAGTEDNPFEKPLGDSYETETARATRVPAVALRRVEGMIRRAAADLKIGVSIAVETDETTGDPIVGEDGKVTITFQGKDRRKRKTKAEAAAEAAETSGTPELSAAGEPVPVPGTAGESEPAPTESESTDAA